jgi:hypothetical protein
MQVPRYLAVSVGATQIYPNSLVLAGTLFKERTESLLSEIGVAVEENNSPPIGTHLGNTLQLLQIIERLEEMDAMLLRCEANWKCLELKNDFRNHARTKQSQRCLRGEDSAQVCE